MFNVGEMVVHNGNVKRIAKIIYYLDADKNNEIFGYKLNDGTFVYEDQIEKM